MNENRNDISTPTVADKADIPYLIINCSLLFLLPALSVAIECAVAKRSISWELIGKWLVFWSIGVRLFTAGIRQATNPQFTAVKIFKMTNLEKNFILIREIGFANISIGTMGILSLINDQWRLIAAITGGLFFGLAALGHSVKRPGSKNELIALLYDWFVFLLILFYLGFSLIVHLKTSA